MVYAPHGVGRVAIREERLVLGVKTEVIVLELADGLSVALPAVAAEGLLRPLLAAPRRVRLQARARLLPSSLPGRAALPESRHGRPREARRPPHLRFRASLRQGSRRRRLHSSSTSNFKEATHSPQERDAELLASRTRWRLRAFAGRSGFCFVGTGATCDPRRSPRKLIGDAFAVEVDAEPVATAPERVTFGS